MNDTLTDTLYNIARIHSEVLRNITEVNKKFISYKDPKYLNYYERLLPLFNGEYECPVCVENLQDKTRACHTIDPEVYFGVLLLHMYDGVRQYASTAALVSSQSAITAFLREYHRLLKTYPNVKEYVQSHYKLSMEEQILQALIQGENTLENIKRSRSLASRWEALEYCVRFNLVSDLYILSCKEFPHPLLGKKLMELQPRVKDYIFQVEKNYKQERLIRVIQRIQEDFYDRGIREIKKNKGRKITRKVKSAQQEWDEWCLNE